MTSTFCQGVSTAQSTYSDTQLKQIMPDGILTKINYSGAESARNSQTGILSDEFISSAVQQLYSSGFAPTGPMISSTDKFQSYIDKDKVFINNVKSEYCYYESRYFYAINKLISDLQRGFNSTDPAVATTINLSLTTAKLLNTRLNDFIQIINGVTNYKYKTADDYNTVISNLNTTLDQRAQLIKSQQQVLNSTTAKSELYKQMVSYTEEKNRANSNLLTLYSFLNIFALGMLFYIYRST
jgi:hypothetical protein